MRKFRSEYSKKTLFSIITISYNEIKNIEKTIKSVANQKYKNIEYIVIDGDSIDGTKDKIIEYKNVIDIFISEKDAGIYDAMNKGIKLASGDAIILLNSGDTFDPNYLSYIASELTCEEIKSTISYSDYVINFSEIDLLIKKKSALKTYKMGICHQTMVVGSQIYRELGEYNLEYKIGSDYDFYLRALLSKRNIFRYHNIISVEYKHGGISSINKVLSLIESNKINVKYFNKYQYQRYIFITYYYWQLISLVYAKNLIIKFFGNEIFNKIRLIKKKILS
jgi:glycosyltransferase involved in cell wall biosynthesis